MTVLDLPLEKQKALAKEEGMTFDAWVEHTKRVLKDSEDHLSRLKTVTFSNQEEAEKAGYNLDKWQQPIVPFPA